MDASEQVKPADEGRLERVVVPLAPERDTYDMPPHGWTCFFCGETFKTIGGAQDHFGATPDKKPGCLLKVSVGAERGLLMELRRVEEELATLYRERADEDTHLHREIRRLQSRHYDALRNAEEAGYERGLSDARRERHNVM